MTTKPTFLHAVEGTTNVTRHKHRANEPKPDGVPVKPKFVKGKASKIWDEYVAIGYWLTSADSLVLAAWCGLAAEMEANLKDMTASRISQWRALGSELGFGPSSRTKINASHADKKTDNPADKFYA